MIPLKIHLRSTGWSARIITKAVWNMAKTMVSKSPYFEGPNPYWSKHPERLELSVLKIWQERRQKMEEIDTLEVQLKEAWSPIQKTYTQKKWLVTTMVSCKNVPWCWALKCAEGVPPSAEAKTVAAAAKRAAQAAEQLAEAAAKEAGCEPCSGFPVQLLSINWLVVWNMKFIFPIILGMSSSQLTKSYFSEG